MRLLACLAETCFIGGVPTREQFFVKWITNAQDMNFHGFRTEFSGRVVSISPRNRIKTEITLKPQLTLVNDASVPDDGSLHLKCIVMRAPVAFASSASGIWRRLGGVR